MKPSYLTLSNGQQFSGEIFNSSASPISGEVVFNTGMTGYEETLTDPSYAGQILVFTYPLLGNYGVAAASRWESDRIQVKAVICSSKMDNLSHHQCERSFSSWLKQQNIPLLSGVDTRELTKTLRNNGTLQGVISQQPATQALQELELISQKTDWVAQVATATHKIHGNGKHKILLVDFGVKQNIIRALLNFDVTIKQVPYNYDYSQEEYAGILLSNGPGDPKDCGKSIAILQQLLAKDIPIFGICLGSQLLGLAAGADTYKLKFGHRGQNQPCQDLRNNRCYLTSQNHGYALCQNSLPAEWEVSFKHLHDNSIAGIRHKYKPFSAVQFHPEAAAGPQDTQFLFNDFMQQVIQRTANS